MVILFKTCVMRDRILNRDPLVTAAAKASTDRPAAALTKIESRFAITNNIMDHQHPLHFFLFQNVVILGQHQMCIYLVFTKSQ